MDKSKYEELQSKYEELQREVQFYREYDALTGLYNKNTFYREAKRMICGNPDKDYFIICIDVERFRVVNDLYGTDKGDEILNYLAGELRTYIADRTAVSARLSADVFAICMPSSESLEALEADIVRAFREVPLDMKLMPAIGFYHISDRELPVSLMCDRAIMALETVKGDYSQHSAVFDNHLRDSFLEEQEIISRADLALANREFEVYMQPKCNMRSGKIVGAEALIRWRHPQKGLIPPAAFVPLYERNGFIKKLDVYVWEESVRWLRSWMDRGNPPIPVSVNVSRIDVIGMDLFRVLEQLLKKYQVPSTALEVEITESAYTSQMEEIVMTVGQLMDAGYTVLMDDFGSGYSSLNMLKDINVNILKLDLCFLDNTDKKSRDILESVVHMAKWLGLRIIAEGVETKSQVEFLLDIGCEYAQGYYYYKPMELKLFEELLSDRERVDYGDGMRAGDIRENLIHFKELFHEDMMTDQLLNNILGGVALYQYDGTSMNVVRCNDEYYWLIYHEGASCQNGEDVMEAIVKEDRRIMHQALADAKIRGERGTEVVVRRRLSGQEIVWLQTRLFYLSESNGKSVYYAGVSDVSDQMQAIEDLRMSELRFRTAMEATGITLFELDVETRTARYSRQSQEAFGLDGVIADAPEGFIEQGTVEKEFEDDFREMYEAIYRGEDRASCEIRACMGDGGIVWNRITLIAIKDYGGNTVKAVGVVENITKEKNVERI